MSDPVQRRSLFPTTPAPRAPLPEATVAAIAVRNGFREPAPPKPEPANVDAARRRRQPTGRDHQFNTRLRRDTLDLIYAEANGRDIPIAQVIEEAMAALLRYRAE